MERMDVVKVTNTSLPNSCISCQHAISIILSKNKGDAEKAALLTGKKGLKKDVSAASASSSPLSTSSLFLIPTLSETMAMNYNHYTCSAAAAEDYHTLCMNDKILKDPETRLQKDDDDLLKQVSAVKCTSCDKSAALLLNGNYHSINKILQNMAKPDGWSKVENEMDRLVLFVLNQIIYREYEVPDEDELQVEYAFPPKTDLAKILWIKGNAVGFYSAKPKGSLDLDSMDWYRMTVFDTLFIRHSERRKGYASSAVEDIIKECTDQNVGFSVPISLPMVQVLKKHLMLHPSDRMKLWEIIGCGLEGSCQILWFLLNRR